MSSPALRRRCRLHSRLADRQDRHLRRLRRCRIIAAGPQHDPGCHDRAHSGQTDQHCGPASFPAAGLRGVIGPGALVAARVGRSRQSAQVHGCGPPTRALRHRGTVRARRLFRGACFAGVRRRLAGPLGRHVLAREQAGRPCSAGIGLCPGCLDVTQCRIHGSGASLRLGSVRRSGVTTYTTVCGGGTGAATGVAHASRMRGAARPSVS